MNNTGEIEITQDLGFEQIVSIIEGTFGQENSPGYKGPIFIDINGNMFFE